MAMIPLLVIYYTAYTINVRVLRDEISGSLRRQNIEFADRLQDEITRIINTNFLLRQNWELGKVSVVPEEFTGYQKATVFRNIQDKIYLVQLTSRFIHSINVYFPMMDKCLSTGSAPSTLTEMRTITAQIDDLPKDQFFLHNGSMTLLSENTFSSTSDTPNLVIQTTLSQKELVSFFQDFYWNEISSGTVTSTLSSDWPTFVAADSLESQLRQEILPLVDARGKTVQESQFLFEHGKQTYQVIYSYIPYVDILLIRFFDVNQIGHMMGINGAMPALFAAVVAIAFLMIYYALYRLVNRPLKRLMNAFNQVEQGNLDIELRQEARGEFAYIFNGFSHMLERLKILLEETYLQGQMVKKSELKQLQAQIDPHFLYNGFFILNKRIRANDNEGALAFSKLLSDYFQYVTQNARDAVPLSEEAAHAYNYARIQQVRFPNRLRLELEPIPAEYAHIPIPRLVLQPIVENVFKHVLDFAEGITSLHIACHGLPEGLELWIENSGPLMTEEKLLAMQQALENVQDNQEISGLTNVHLRLKLFCGEDYGLFYDRIETGGLRVRLRIPYRKETCNETHPSGR